MNESEQDQKLEPVITLKFAPEIHPEDALAALRAWVDRTQKNRKKPTPAALAEDLFLPGVATTGEPWSERQVRTIHRLSESKDFKERFARSLEEGRAHIWDPVDIFILKNWRRLADESLRSKLPGLEDWNPASAIQLIVCEGLTNEAEADKQEDKEAWYVKRRKRLGLHGKEHYRVRHKDWGGNRVDITVGGTELSLFLSGG